MKRNDELPLTRHSLNLYAGDYNKIQSLYPTRLGAAKIIRNIIRAHIRMIEDTAAQRVDLVDTLDMEETDVGAN